MLRLVRWLKEEGLDASAIATPFDADSGEGEVGESAGNMAYRSPKLPAPFTTLLQ